MLLLDFFQPSLLLYLGHCNCRFSLEYFDFYSGLSSLYELILGRLEILSGLVYPTLLVLQPLFLASYHKYHPIEEELAHDLTMMDTPREFPTVLGGQTLLLIMLDQ